MTLSTTHARELAVRESDCVHVVLSWNPDEDVVTVGDRRAAELACALDAFYHPYAYAA